MEKLPRHKSCKINDVHIALMFGLLNVKNKVIKTIVRKEMAYHSGKQELIACKFISLPGTKLLHNI